MDPNVSLARLRDAMARLHTHEQKPEWETAPSALRAHDDDLRDAVDAFEALDGWLSRDGFLPADWKSDDEKNATVCGCGQPLVWVDDHWEHNVAPSYWGNDHDPDPS